MTAVSITMPFPARLKSELKLDPVLLTIALTLLLGGLVVLASASISISDHATGDAFFYVRRQLLAAAIGAVAAGACLFIPMRVWQSLRLLLLLAPACASFDQFANYMARGDAFSRAVRELAA